MTSTGRDVLVLVGVFVLVLVFVPRAACSAVSRARPSYTRTSMLRRHALLTLALLALPSPAHAQPVTGTLERIDTAEGTITIRTASTTRTGRITPQTMVIAAGMPGDVRDLRPGQQVVVQFAVSQRGATRADVVRIEIRG